PGHPSITAALAGFAAALARCPWLERSLLALRDVTPLVRDATLFVIDRDGRALPIAPEFRKPWHLAALSGGRPFHLYGEWDGQRLLPLGVAADGLFHDVGPRATA